MSLMVFGNTPYLRRNYLESEEIAQTEALKEGEVSKMQAQKTDDQKKVGLKEAGLKATLPRIKILHILETSPTRHMSAEEIYTTLKSSGMDVGLATVYRVLAQFEAAGIVVRHRFEEGGHSVFELYQEDHHDHLMCIRCGRVEEFLDPVIEERQIAIAQQFKFKITDHHLYLYGLCANCE